MSRYNSQFSGSQIDSAISQVLSGYQIAVLTSSLNVSGSLNVYGDITASNARVTASLWVSGSTVFTGSVDITGSLNFKGKPILILSTSNFMSVYDNSDSFVIMNVGKNPFPVYGVVFNAGDITQDNNGTQISLSDYQKEIDLTSLGIVKLGDTNGTTTKLIVDVVRSKVDITGSLNVNTIIAGLNNTYNTITTRDGSDQIVIKSLEDKSLPSGDVNTSITLTPSTLTFQGAQGAPSAVVNYIELKTVAAYSTIDLNADYVRFEDSNVEISGSLNVSGSIEPISGSSLILLSPNGTRFKLTVDDYGIVSASLA